MPTPLVSIVIVSWNSGHDLQHCLDCLDALDYEHFDIQIVDNDSKDGSIEQVSRNYPQIKYHQFPENRGFCRAFNWGVDHTSGEFVLSLNPDVFARPGFLHEMLAAASQDDRIGSVAPRLLRADEPVLLDSSGLFLGRSRRPYDRGQGETDTKQYDRSQEVFGACGAAALYRRTMLEDIAVEGQYFDEDFFAYYEDADLAWRAQLRGWEARYAPRAAAEHVRGWGDTLRKRGPSSQDIDGPRLALRNRWLMVLKNDTWRDFLLDFPFILFTDLPRLMYMALFVPRALLGLKDFLIAFRPAMEKRRVIQNQRLVENADVRAWFKPQKAQT